MLKKFVKDQFLLQILNWLIKPVWIFGIERYVQNQSGDAVYGEYYAVFNFVLLFGFLLDFGINSYLTSEVSKSNNANIVNPLLRIRLWLNFVYLLLVIALGIASNLPLNYLGLILVGQVLSGFSMFYRAILQGQHLFKKDAILSVMDRVIALIGFIIFVLLYDFTPEILVQAFLAAQLLGYGTALLLGWYWSRGLNITQKNNPISFKEVAVKTILFAALALLMSLFTRLDVVLIRYLLPLGNIEAGIYAKGFRLLDAGLIFSGMISLQLLPNFGKLLGDKEALQKLIWLGFRIVLVVSFSAACFTLFYAEDIQKTLYHTVSLHLNSVLILLLFAFIPMGLVHVFGTYLTAAHQLKFLLTIAAMAVLLNIGLDFYWIPKYKAIGAAAACLFTQSFFVACLITKTYLELKISIQIKSGINILMFIFACATLVYFSAQIQNFGLRIVAGILSIPLSIFLSGIFSTEMNKLLRKY